MESGHSQSSSQQSALVAVMAIIIVVLAGSTLYFYYKYRQVSISVPARVGYNMMGSGSVPSGMMGQRGNGAMMQQLPTPTLTAQQNTEITAGPSKATKQKTFDIDGGNFYFTPNKITVNKGDTVTIVFHDDRGNHNFMLDEFDAKTATIQGGNTISVTFAADKIGSFEYYCSIGRHRQMGMWGTLTVQ